jgi:MFS family permease
LQRHIWDRISLPYKAPSIALLCLCVLLSLSLWFSVSSVVPTLKGAYGLSDGRAAWLSSSVSVGFVFGTLASAILGLADRLHPRHFFALSALIAAGANAMILLFEPTAFAVVLLRFVTGACMAGIYPVGMKMAATWARGDTGLLVGILIAALCIGTASPHLINAWNGLDWRSTVIGASLLAGTAGLLVNFVGLGPALAKAPPFQPGYVLHAWNEKPLRLTNLGYFGHKWENYAMWTWIGVFLQQSFELSFGGDAGRAAFLAGIVTFAVVACGAPGSFVAGILADRRGRTAVILWSLAISGSCTVLAGFAFGGNPWIVTAICIAWGLTVVSDSGQFSSCIIELSDKSHIGTMLTVQTCIGYLITLFSIHLIPVVVDAVGWRYAFASLAIGPALGIVSILQLRRHPAAERLAGGNR